MRHRKRRTRLGRTGSHKAAMLANMVSSLIEHESIRTTKESAKEARRLADKMVTLAKNGSLASRRRALAKLHNKRAISKLFAEIGPRNAARNGGYTRIIPLDEPRLGDKASQVLFQLVERAQKEAPASKEAKKT